MNRKERKLARIEAGMRQMSADERAAVDRALIQIKRMSRGSVRMLEILGDLLAARGRAARRAASDRVTDKRRRITISAHVSRELYQRILDNCAGRSIYRFILDAVTELCEREEHLRFVMKTLEQEAVDGITER